jgi:septum formation protein
MKTLVLASQSPGRKQVLENAGVQFRVVVSNYVEDMSLKLKPRDLAIYLSKGKASDVAGREKNAFVIGADSFVVFKGRVIGKPHTEEKSIEVLKELSGNYHDFITGFTIIDSETNRTFSGSALTRVYFKTLSNQAIIDYIQSDNVLEKAGAYSTQGNGQILIDKIVGDKNNLRGLPVNKVLKVLQQFGYEHPTYHKNAH